MLTKVQRYNEIRLTVYGLIFGITGVSLVGITRVCLVVRSESIYSANLMNEANQSFYIMTLGFGTIITGATAYHFENVPLFRSLSDETVAVMALNTAAMVGAMFSGTTIMVFSTFPFSGGTLYFNTIAWGEGLLVTISSNFLLLLATILSKPHPYISWIQIAAYLTANIFLFKLNRIHDTVYSCLSYIAKFSHGTSRQKYQPNKYIAAFFIAIPVIILSYLIALLSTITIEALPRGRSVTYDHSFQPASRFDIVVSMYDESPSSVADMLNQITATTLFQQLTASHQPPRIIIYTKNSLADLASLKQTTGADIVERLENRGREGGTYLSHIVDKWDSLAEQTLFVQAHAHNIRELIPRIKTYLVSDTGMLSLSFSGISCSCDTCVDRWGWEDDERMVPNLFKHVYGVPCTNHQPILLSYKGQFVASARRIRGVDKTIYIDLLERITGVKENGTENRHGVTGIESASNPFFGFTMERLWGLLMQCATDQRITSRCPTLLSGMDIRGSVQDCQCLDEIR